MQKTLQMKQSISKDIIQMLVNVVALPYVTTKTVKKESCIQDVLSKDTPDYEMDLLCKSINKKYHVNISDLLTNVKTVDDLCGVVAGQILIRNMTLTKAAKQNTENNARDNMKANLVAELSSTLANDGFIDKNNQLIFKTTAHYGILADIINKKYRINVSADIFKVKSFDDLTNLIVNKKLERFYIKNIRQENHYKDIYNTATDVVIKMLGLDKRTKIPENAVLQDYFNMDSLTMLEFAVELEKVFKFTIPNDIIQRKMQFREFCILYNCELKKQKTQLVINKMAQRQKA